MNRPSISVVIPVYRSGKMLASLYERLCMVLEKMSDEWEVILVDDASNDGTFMQMLLLRDKDQRVKLIRFARNMGQHHATLCGLQRASGEIVYTLDDDLQTPPEEMPKLLDAIGENCDLAIGRIGNDKKHSIARNLSSRFVQWLITILLGKPKDLSLSSYRCMTRRALAGISSFTGAHPYLPALMLNAVPIERIANVTVAHNERAQGRSTYTLSKLLKLASYLLINHSYLPLRFVTAWGFLLSVMSLLYAIWVLCKVIFIGSGVSGWPSLAILVAFLSGNILMCMGILGEYVGRLVEENSRARQFPIFEEYL